MITDAPTPPAAWEGYGRRILEWWNTLADFVNTLRSDVDDNTTTLAAAGAIVSYSPAFANIPVSAQSGYYSQVGDLVFFYATATVSGAATSFVTCTIPVAAHAIEGTNENPKITWNLEDTSTGASYSAVGFISGTSLTARRTANAGQSGAWTTGVPLVFASGDVLEVGGFYRKA